MSLKSKVYKLLPKKTRKKAKNFYYDKLIGLLYFIKHKIHYGQGDFFNTIAIENTTYCNLRCKFCPNSLHTRGLKENEKLIDESLWRKIIDELAEINYNGEFTPVFYGEPLADSRIISLMTYARNKLPRSRISISSNGFLLTIPLYQELIKAGVDRIIISEYSGAMPPSVKEVLEYLKTRPKKENKIDYRIFTKDLAANRGGELEEVDTTFDKPYCTYPDSPLIIDANGNAVLCCNDYHSSIVFGNAKEEKIVDIWNKPHYKKLRKELKKEIYKLPICKKCMNVE